jgi:hypothetical protein
LEKIMTTWKVLAVAYACAWAGSAVAQTEPQAVSTTPKVLTTPAPFDGGVGIIKSGTGFWLGWNSGPDFAQNQGTGVFARLFSSTGVATKPVATLRAKTPNLVGRPKVAPGKLAGKFGVVWENVEQTFAGTHFVEGGIFDTATNKIGTLKRIGNTTGPIHEIIQMTTGNLALITQQNGTSAKQRFVLYTLDGTTFAKLKGPVAVNGAGTTDIGQSYDHTIVPKTAGGFAIYRNRDTNPSVLLMRGFNQDAVVDSSVVQVNSTPFLTGISGNDLLKFSVRAARLSNNNIIVTWAHFQNVPASSYEVRARLFTNLGAPIGNDFMVNMITTNDQYWPKPIALANGKFAIMWLSEEVNNTRRHYVRTYNANRTPAGTAKLTQNAMFPSSVTVDNAIARLSDGSAVDAFHDSNFNQERILGDGIPAALLQ